MKTALSIAGSDCSGGAGIQADIKTMTLNGVYAMSAITALTAQNTTGVFDIQESTPLFLQEQLDAIFNDIYPDAIKIGMVSNCELIKIIYHTLLKYHAKNIVVDPVMVSTSGSSLMKTDAIQTLETLLFPIASVITPNIPEAQVLSDTTIANEKDMEQAALCLNKQYRCSVLIKGGHEINEANDVLCIDQSILWFHGKRINNPNTHGTGCTLSSAIASNLAKGYDIPTSIKRSKEYISQALKTMLNLGKGSGPMNHAFDLNSQFSK